MAAMSEDQLIKIKYKYQISVSVLFEFNDVFKEMFKVALRFLLLSSYFFDLSLRNLCFHLRNFVILHSMTNTSDVNFE